MPDRETGLADGTVPDGDLHDDHERLPIRLRETDIITRPLLMGSRFSPTIHLYDQYAGTGQVGHFRQQGHEYYVTFPETAN